MSDLKNADGGPAFPIATVFNPNSGEPVNTGQYWDGNGMSLRDYFAGMALQGLLAMCAGPDIDVGTAEKAAGYAYQYADAMLQERMKSKP